MLTEGLIEKNIGAFIPKLGKFHLYFTSVCRKLNKIWVYI